MGPRLDVDRVFVVHVRKGLEERERFIREQFDALGIDFQFVLEADRDELPDAMLEDWFGGELRARTAATSCAAKHLLAYETMVREAIPWAIVFEDDIVLAPRFVETCNAVLAEARAREDVPRSSVLVSLENSELKLVPRGEAVPGRYLYRRGSGRSAGAYLLDLGAARAILEHARRHKVRNGGIDWFHNEVVDASEIALYWCHPPIAEQGSHSGLFSSAIVGKRGGWLRRIRWRIQKWYKYRIRYRVRD